MIAVRVVALHRADQPVEHRERRVEHLAHGDRVVQAGDLACGVGEAMN
jgi:hypothetical protein